MSGMNEWFEKNGFNENGETYVYYPEDSYSVKDDLKDSGFKFSKMLLWHCGNVPKGYENKVIKVDFNNIGERSAWGEGFFRPDTRSIVDAALKTVRPPKPETEFYGAEQEKIVKLPVFVESFRQITTKYGTTNLIKFTTEKYQFQWFTTSEPKIEEGQTVLLSATIKKHDTFNGVKYTTITRAKFN